MKKLTLGALLASAIVTCASAGTINGSMAIAVTGTIVGSGGTDLSNFTSLLNPGYLVTSAMGDYVPVVGFAAPASTLNFSNLSTFTMNFGSFGSFIANGVGSSIVSRNANFSDIFIRGTLTPGAGLAAGLSPSDTGLRFSYTQSGASISGSLTLNSPAVAPGTVPEPATLAPIGGGLIAFGVVRRRRKVQA